MTTKQKTEIIDAIQKDLFYDWVCKHYFELSNYELVTILKEYAYAVDKLSAQIVSDGIVEELIDRLDTE